MKRLFAIAVLLSVGFSIDIPLLEFASAAKPGGPTKLGPPILYYAGKGWLTGNRHLYAADLNGDGIDEVVFSGAFRRNLRFRTVVVDAKGRNVTRKYLRYNKINNETTDVADLNGDGKDDLIFWGGTDSEVLAPSYVFLSSKKNAYTRKVITPKIWYHGSGKGDLDGDGKDDFVGTGYRGRWKYVVSYKNKLLIRKLKYTGSMCCFDGRDDIGYHQGSDIAIGNFDADSNVELIITDYHQNPQARAVEVYKTDNKYIYVRDDAGITLPTAYFKTARGKSKIRKYYKSTAYMNSLQRLSHNIRLEPFDINRDGLTDLIRWSRPESNDPDAGSTSGEFWPIEAYPQMLISNGKGKFSDKTGKYLKRWKMNVSAPYDFTYADINKDGLTDIFYTSGSSDVDPKTEWDYGIPYRKFTPGVGFLINTGKGFKNYGNAWILRLRNKAWNASAKVHDYVDDRMSVPVTLGNFDSDDDLEIASCTLAGMNVSSDMRSHCAFWFSDITLKFPKYKAKKTSELNKYSLPEDIHVIKKQPGKRIYTDQPWRYLE